MEVNVIDVGCAHYQSFKSIEHICDQDEFEVKFALGLDPRCEPDTYWYRDETLVTMLDMAAWTSTGSAGFMEDALGSHVLEAGDGDRRVKTIDLAPLVRVFSPVVLKIDAEGAEYPLLEHLLDQGITNLIHLAWIEWHGDESRAKPLIDRLECDYAEWRL